MRNIDEGLALHAQREVDLQKVFAVLWGGRLSIFLITLAFASASVFIAVSVSDRYRSEATLVPRVESRPGGALGQLAAQYGGLAGIAGVSLGGMGEADKSRVALHVLKSRNFFEKYLYESVLVDLMAATGWDPASNLTIIEPSIYDPQTKAWVRKVSAPLSAKPSVQEAYEKFVQDHVEITDDKQLGIVTVAVVHYSPEVARDWVFMLVDGVNDAVRQRDVQEAENSIIFLNEQTKKTSLVSLTEVFADLIEQQTKTVMLANASTEYVFQIIDPPVAAEVKSEPNRALISILGAASGGTLALFYVLIRHYFRTRSGLKRDEAES
ncbi:MAG: LPS O-antigen length regulator [Gammaproteobacteria bacterium]|nr:LPS O-antigen length regulator [Gammaproteobacteria bacterium]